MCNHKPVDLHEGGGTSVICELCGRVLKPWRSRGESGQCLAICLLALGGAMIAFLTWVIIMRLTNLQVLADIGATVVFLVIFGLAMKLCEGGR